METKELKIQVPEGYEIDKGNSTFECISNENDEHERDAAWDDVYMTFPDADYIEEF